MQATPFLQSWACSECSKLSVLNIGGFSKHLKSLNWMRRLHLHLGWEHSLCWHICQECTLQFVFLMQEHFWNQQTNVLQLTLQIMPRGAFLPGIQFVVGVGANVQMDLQGLRAYEARGFTIHIQNLQGVNFFIVSISLFFLVAERTLHYFCTVKWVHWRSIISTNTVAAEFHAAYQTHIL